MKAGAHPSTERQLCIAGDLHELVVRSRVMSGTCPDCGRALGLGREPVQTMTGRTVCAECRDDLLAAAAGVVTKPASPVAGAIATQGWFRLFRKRKKQP